MFCGGGPVGAPLPPLRAPFVVAADIGAVEARRLGLRVDVLVGDLDSVPPEVAEAIERDGGRVDRYPADKDATDLELGLTAASAAGATRVVVAGGDGGRLDHLLGNVLLLASERFRALEIDAVLGASLVHVVRTRRSIRGEPGETLSLFAIGGPARGVRTTGLRWSLAGEDLEAGSSRGISNAFAEQVATIESSAGVLVAVRPGVES